MSVQVNEFAFLKQLLKQVYSAHTSKVKELQELLSVKENEVLILKEQLLVKENEVKILEGQFSVKVRESDNVSNCKRCSELEARCIELEAAFKNCKKTLQEQLMLFGQKFSIFNGSEKGSQELKAPAKLCETTLLPLEESVSSQNVTDSTLKESVVPCNQNLFKKVMCDDGSLGTFDMCTITFAQNLNDGETSSKKCDYTLFAPDSVEVDHDIKKGIKRRSTDCFSEDNNHKKALNTESRSHDQNNKETGKRLSPDSLTEDRQSKLHKNNKLDNSNVKKLIIAKVDEITQMQSSHLNMSTNCSALKKSVKESETKNVQMIQKSKEALEVVIPDENKITVTSKTNFSDADRKSMKESKYVQMVQKDKKAMEVVISSEDKSTVLSKGNFSDTDKKGVKLSETKNVQMVQKSKEAVEVLIPNENKTTVTPKAIFSPSVINNIHKVTSPYETSPSLLPTNTNAVAVPKRIETIVNENDDFIESASSSSKSNQSDDSWNTCGKRKILRKNRLTKSIKCSSKFKMILDAPPPNYKKPAFKQSKLSKSFFQGKHVKNSTAKVASKLKEATENETIPIIVVDEFQTSTPYDISPRPVDIDATFIPENYGDQLTPLGTTNVKRNAVEISNLRNGSLFSNISFPGQLKSTSWLENSDIEEIPNSPSVEDQEYKENMNSFDKLPVAEEPNYKYKNDVVRKKAERKQLNGFDCKECEKYYSELGLSDKEKKERLKKCSRHRAKFAPPATPDHFWELDFPDTQECKARGYMDKTQKVKLNM